MDKSNLKFFIDQHGCAKNQVDGELLIAFLEEEGCVLAQEPGEADLIIINSCGFIESAKKESLDAAIEAKNSFPDAKILLAGCLAQRYAEELRENLPEADGIFGNGDLGQIRRVLCELRGQKRPVIVPAQEGVCCGRRSTLLQYPGSAYVKITEGCNNCCTFCAIPLIRGELRSRPAGEIVSEIRELLSRGIFEINLIGQDLAAYGTGTNDDVLAGIRANSGGKSPLHVLLEEISKIQGNFWLRLLYIHPDHFDAEILSALKSDRRILPYFDIPFQSGDDGLILAMNRTGSAEKYVALAGKIRAEFSDAALRTTFMAGFPGESDAAAQNSLDFMAAIEPDWSGCFCYSREDGTPAAKMKGRVARRVAASRAEALKARQAEITRRRLAGRAGQEYDILIEEIVEGAQGLAIGRAWFQAPEVDGSVVVSYDRDSPQQAALVRPGRLVRAKITASGEIDLDAILLGDSPLNEGRAADGMRYLV